MTNIMQRQSITYTIYFLFVAGFNFFLMFEAKLDYTTVFQLSKVSKHDVIITTFAALGD